MKKHIIKILVFGLSMLFVYPLACADEIGKFTAIEGRVDILKSGEDRTIPAREGDIVSSGSIIRTKSLAKAEIKFTDKTILKLAQNTRLEIKEYTFNEFRLRENAVIDLQRGEIRAIIKKTIGPTNFFVNTPNASGSVKGSDIFVFYHKSATGVLVEDGEFSVINNEFPDQEIEVSKGFLAVVPSDQPPQEPRPYLDIEKNRHEAQVTIVRAPALDDPSQIRAVVVKLSGEVKVKRAGSTTWRNVTLHDVLTTGDQIATKESGKLEFKLDNGHIITLKPNSTIILKKLIRDLDTGDEENLFESNLGNIRAKVQKLKGNSKFEIKSPTAVASIRGTTLYLMILPGLTTVFLEDGDGSITSLISQVSKIVQDGQTSSADDQGNVSDSTDATDEQKSGWSSGWDPGEGEGYSPPEGGEGGGDFGEEDEGGDEGGGDTGDTPPVNVPPDPESGGGGGFSGLTGTFTGEHFGSLGKGIAATITSDGTFLSNPPGDSEELPIATVSGTYNSNDETIWLSNIEGTDTSGGAFLGWIGGTWLSWEGKLLGLYIDSIGKAGIIGGDFSGTNDTTIFSGDGKINFAPMVETDVLPAELANSVTSRDFNAGNFWGILGDTAGNTENIRGEFDREQKYITNPSWGIYRDIYSVDYSNHNGVAEFTGGVLQGYNNGGLSVALLKGADNSNNSLSMNILGQYLGYELKGIYEGSLLGAYTQRNSHDLEAVGLGLFAEEQFDEPLAYVGFWGQDIETLKGTSNGGNHTVTSLYYNDLGDITRAGEECGLIGGDISPWSGETEFYAMGYYYDWETEPYIWNTPIYSYNPQEDNHTTRDGGAFYGATAGIWNDEKMDGFAVAFYLSPTGTEGIYDAGFLRGSIEGDYYPAFSMWMADGTLSPTIMDYGIKFPPGDFSESPYKDYDMGKAKLTGDFNGVGTNGVGTIEGTLASGYSLAISEDLDDWGIYDIKFGDGNTYFNPDPTTYTSWSAVAGGGVVEYDDYWLVDVAGSWQNNEIRADVTGTILSDMYLGTMEGKFYGVNNGYDGTWIGSSVGTWEEEPLTFSGFWEGEEVGSLYYNDSGDIKKAGAEYGLIGSTTPDWWLEKSFPITAMGEYAAPEGRYIWNTPIFSENESEGNFTAQDGSAFFGRTAGIWNNGQMDGSAVALYFSPTGTPGIYDAGFLTGDVEGEYYPGISMWMVRDGNGILSPTHKESGIELVIPTNWEEYPLDELGAADIGGVYMLSGDFNGPGNIKGNMASWYDAAINDEADWGIYDLKFGAGSSYYNQNPETNTDWSGIIGAITEEEGETIYVLADVSGTWQNDEIRANVSGDYLSDEYLGTMDGKFYGVNNGYDGTWIGSSVGTWEEELLAFSGEADLDEGGFGYYDIANNSLYLADGDLTFLLGSTESLWTGNPSVTIMGEFENLEGHGLWRSDFTGQTTDGAALLGAIGGTDVDDSLDGWLLAHYIRPDGGGYRAGYIMSSDEQGEFSPIIGDFHPEIGMFGTSRCYTMAYYDVPTTITPDQLYYGSPYLDMGEHEGFISSESGNFSGTGMIESFDLEDAVIEQNWSLWNVDCGGTFNALPLDNWEANIGGSGIGGHDIDFWLLDITGEEWSDNKFSVAVEGTQLSLKGPGIIRGNAIGTYDEIGKTWQALGAGVQEASGEPATFSGLWKWEEGDGENGGPGCIYYNDGGYPQIAGKDIGVVVSTTPDWWEENSFPYLTMGEFRYYDLPELDLRRIWNSPVDSLNAENHYYTTADDGAFSGDTGGVLNSGMNGGIYLLYIDPYGNIGYVVGDVDGDFTQLYEDMEGVHFIWVADGELAPAEMFTATGLLPELFVEGEPYDDANDSGWYDDDEEFEDVNGNGNWDRPYIREGDLDAELGADFGGDGYIEGESTEEGNASCHTSFIYDSENELASYPFGLIDIMLGSNFGDSEHGYSNPEDSTEWSGAIGGEGLFGFYSSDEEDWGWWLAEVEDGAWENGEITADIVNGNYITYTQAGDVWGELWGIYDEAVEDQGYWIAKGLGVYSGAPLTFMSEPDSSLYAPVACSEGSYYDYWTPSTYYSYNYSYYQDNSYGYHYYYTHNPYSREYAYYYSSGYYQGSNTRYGSFSGYWDDRDGGLGYSDLSFLEMPFSFYMTDGDPDLDLDLHDFDNSWSESYAELNERGELYGILGGTQSLWDNDQVDDALFIGSYSTYGDGGGNRGYTWGTGIHSTNYIDGSRTTYDKVASYYGSIGGYLKNPAEAIIRALYIDPSGGAGYLSGNLDGRSYPEIEMFKMTGTIKKNPMARDVGISPLDFGDDPWDYLYDGELDAALTGSFLDEEGEEVGTIEGEEGDEGTTLAIINQPWGIYDLFGLAGTYENLTGEWRADIGGEGDFGTYEYDGWDWDNDQGYWLGSIENGTVEDSILRGDISGNFLTYTKMGSINGEFLGLTNEDNLWHAVSLGEWEGTPLTFSGYWGEDTLYYNDGGYLGGEAGEEYGFIGATTSPWDGPATFLAMGGYEDERESEPYIWNTFIYSYNETEDEYQYTTIDGGAFIGCTGGIWNDGTMNGSAVAFYADPHGYVGLLTSDDVLGYYFPYLEIWTAEGTLTATQMASLDDLGIDPEDFFEYPDDYLNFREMDNVKLTGKFAHWEDSEIKRRQDEYEGYISFIVDENGNGQPWGIYDLKLAGTYKTLLTSRAWRADISGKGLFGDYYAQGVMKGDIFGTYDMRRGTLMPRAGYGDWIATNLGTWNSYNVDYGTPFDGNNSKYVGFAGGILLDDGTMIGKTAAIYSQPYRRDDIEYGWIEGIGSGRFGDGGAIEIDYFSGDAVGIEGQYWGVWGGDFEAVYNNPDGLEDWRGGLGLYVAAADEFLLLGSVDGTDLLDEQVLRLDLLAYAFDDFDEPRGLVTLSGTTFGTYEPSTSYDYEGVGVGSLQAEPLTFSGLWGEEETSLYYNDDGEIALAGEDFGVIGSTSPSWWLDSAPFVAMGEYWLDEVNEDEPLLWNTPIYSYNFIEGEDFTYDDGAFFGYTGGIWKDLTLDGAVAAIYLDPEGNAAGFLTGDASGYYFPFYDESWVATGSLTPTLMVDLEIDPDGLEDYIDWGEMEGAVSGSFSDIGVIGDINGWTDWGETAFIHDEDISQPWGIYDLKFGRLGSPNSYGSRGDSTTWFALADGAGGFGYSEGSWLGCTGGIWQDGEIQGALRALYITDANSAGLIKGDVFGLYDEGGDTWVGESIGIYTEMGTTGFSFEDLEDFESPGIEYVEFEGTGLGSFEGGGSLECASIEGIDFGLFDQDWSIWAAGLSGTYTGPNSPFRLALGCIIYEEDDPGDRDGDGYLLGTVDGDWDSGRLSGPFRGVALFDSYENDDVIEADIVTGDVIGTYIDVDEAGTGTWQAAGIGDWVEVTDLFTPTNLGFTLENLEQFVSVPITEVHTNLLTGANDFITAATMDISIYQNELNSLWAALIYGNYSHEPAIVDDWSLSLGNGGDNVTLVGEDWSSNEWLATVGPDSIVNGNAITGAAAGTYGDNEFQGVGAGIVGEIED